MGEPTKTSANVLIAWPNLVPTNHAGAVRGASLAEAVQSLGWKPIVVTPRSSDERTFSTLNPHVDFLTLYDSYASRFPAPAPFFALPLTVLRLVSAARRGEAQIAITSTPGLFLALETCLVSLLLGIPFVLDVRDAWALEEVTHAGFLRNWFKKTLEGIICRRASTVWTVTRSLARMLIESHGLRPGKLEIVPNGANLSIFRVDPKPKEFDLVFSGVPSLYRDVPLLVEAFQTVASRRPGLTILWLGWRDTELAKETQWRLNTLVQGGTLRLSPPVDHGMVPDALSRCRIGVVSLSSHAVFRTAIGAKVYEYLASGLPLLCLGPSGESELRELVESEEVGFYATSTREFAEGAIEMLGSPDLLSRISQNCLTTALKYDRTTVFRRALLHESAPI